MLGLSRHSSHSPFVIIGTAYALLGVLYSVTLLNLVKTWISSDEYGHGLFIALIAIYILWQRRTWIASVKINPSWPALLLLTFSIALYAITLLSDIEFAQRYTFVASLFFASAALLGFRSTGPILFPLSLFIFAIPFHSSINSALTSQLQLLSSNIGVWFIRLMGLPVLQDGNVINMGSFVLLVEEACSGLRYLLPLTSLSLLAAYFYRANLLLKSIIFISVIPITIVMNSLRIAITGLIIKYFGASAAQGFLHDFEGLAVFAVACILFAALVVGITLLRGKPLRFDENFARAAPNSTLSPLDYKANASALATVSVILLSIPAINYIIRHVPDVVPERSNFSSFPLVVGSRDLYPDKLDDVFLEMLKPDDYLIGDYLIREHPPINLYMAHYQKQREGSLIHSPRDCLPAGGWNILSSSKIELKQLGLQGYATRAMIKKDGTTLLVYYWVNQQGVNHTSTIDIYLTLIKNMLLKGRSDATLVRIFIPVSDASGEWPEPTAEQELQNFVRSLVKIFPEYLPI